METAVNDYYILDNHKPVPCDLMTWARWFEHSPNRRVCATTIGDVRISTVFLGLDHSFGAEGPPILFETMTFGMPEDEGMMERCATWEQAQAQHVAVVQRVVALLESLPAASGNPADARSDDK